MWWIFPNMNWLNFDWPSCYILSAVPISIQCRGVRTGRMLSVGIYWRGTCQPNYQGLSPSMCLLGFKLRSKPWFYGFGSNRILYTCCLLLWALSPLWSALNCLDLQNFWNCAGSKSPFLFSERLGRSFRQESKAESSRAQCFQACNAPLPLPCHDICLEFSNIVESIHSSCNL